MATIKRLVEETRERNEGGGEEEIEASTKSLFTMEVKIVIRIPFEEARAPFNYNSKASTDMVGLHNLGATCYLNALLQMLYHVNVFRRAVYEMPFESESFGSSGSLSLQALFKNLQLSKDTVSTIDLTRAFGWTSADAFMQQDVQEMMRVLLDQIEEKMRGTPCDGKVGSLFAGTLKSFIKCTEIEYESKREEAFYDIQLDVRGCADVMESFRKYVASEDLVGENQYDALVHGKQDAKKGVIFTKFPPVLTIHLKRFEFDVSQMTQTKVHDKYAFPARLSLDEFLADDAPAESRSSPNNYLLHSVLVHSVSIILFFFFLLIY